MTWTPGEKAGYRTPSGDIVEGIVRLDENDDPVLTIPVTDDEAFVQLPKKWLKGIVVQDDWGVVWVSLTADANSFVEVPVDRFFPSKRKFEDISGPQVLFGGFED